MNSDKKIAIIGLGYVGLPLARLFATKYSVVGFDIDRKRISDLQNGVDLTKELSAAQLKPILKTQKTDKIGLFCSNNIEDISDSNFYIITVPTPVTKDNLPDLSPLFTASETVGKLLKVGDIVVYESTVYPGATEEDCVPILEKFSGLKFNIDFFAGYSPERINPGDKLHTVDKIVKVTSGSTPEIAIIIDEIYKSVITAGTHLAPSIKVAEAAKVIENSQRDINIAFVNELAKIFNLLAIDTHEVLEAAGTKWNFLPFKPGLVGGHCIGVDPYYLAEKAKSVGYHPEIILAGLENIVVKKASLLLLGITFKENCPDIRNSKLFDLIDFLLDYGIEVTVYDPNVDILNIKVKNKISITNQLPNDTFDAVVLGVAHHQFLDLNIERLRKQNSVLYDIKGVLSHNVDGRL